MARCSFSTPGTISVDAANGSFAEAVAGCVAHRHAGSGKLYSGTGQRDQAQEHLTTATTMYREMGMTYWLEKAEQEIRELK
jgi:hypothetical protein